MLVCAFPPKICQNLCPKSKPNLSRSSKEFDYLLHCFLSVSCSLEGRGWTVATKAVCAVIPDLTGSRGSTKNGVRMPPLRRFPDRDSSLAMRCSQAAGPCTYAGSACVHLRARSVPPSATSRVWRGQNWLRCFSSSSAVWELELPHP